jgi:hypothetical protein
MTRESRNSGSRRDGRCQDTRSRCNKYIHSSRLTIERGVSYADRVESNLQLVVKRT